MKTKTFEEFKDEVAKDHAYPNWDAIPYKKQLIWIEMVCKKFTLQEKKAYALEIANDALINAALRLERSELCHKGDWQFIELEIIDPVNIHIK